MIFDAEIERLVHRVVAVYAPEAVYLFGSMAKGCAGPRSDVDLLLVKESSTPRYRRGRTVRGLLSSWDRHVDFLCYTPDELADEQRDPYSFVSAIMHTAVKIYERDARGGIVMLRSG